MNHLSALTIIVAALAAYRLTRLVVADKITEPVIGWLADRGGPRVAYLLSCWWCSGLWMSLFVSIPVLLAPDSIIVAVILVPFAISAIVGLIAGATEHDDEPAPDEFDPTVAPNIVGVDRDAMLDLRARLLHWLGDIDLVRARAKTGVLAPGEAVAWDAVTLIETELARRSPIDDTVNE